jgi:peptidoglycan/LPS O-acetylase OafA/YrhL
MRSNNIQYLPAIDQLRGMAALLIVFYHGLALVSYQLIHHKPFSTNEWLDAGNPISALFIEGHTAVTLFMVLSGYIFTIGTYGSQIKYNAFIFNRFLRTYPLFILVLFIGISSFPSSFNITGFLQTLFFMGNYQGAISAGNFTAMFWAIAVEWQFYLLFPFLLQFVNRKGITFLFGIIIIVILLRGMAYLQDADIHRISYWTIMGRLDQFLVGMLIGVLYVNHFKENFAVDLLFILAFMFLMLGLYVFNKLGGWPSKTYLKIFWPTIEALIWSAFIFGYLSFSRWVPRLVGRALCSIGNISYSVYLLHFVIINLCIKYDFILIVFESRHFINAIITTAFVITPITLVLSALTFNYIEKPFLDMRIKYKKNESIG